MFSTPTMPGRLAKAMLLLAPLPVLIVAGSEWHVVIQRLDSLLRPIGSKFSALSLGCALAIAAATIVLRHRRPGRRLTLRLLRRALLPARLFRAASVRADLGFFLMNGIFTGSLVGWSLLSFPFVERAFAAALTDVLGPPAGGAGGPLAACAQTCIVFLTFEFAYYVDHYTSHRFDFFWEIHRVHHTAEVLTPLTLFRVHPLEAIKYHNIVVVMTAFASALASRWLGTSAWTVDGSNVLLVVFYLCVNHLQHSHMWIAFTGPLGRILASPAHHQMHHSSDPAHAGRNLGWSLAVFDWAFGTLRIPAKRCEVARFGVASGPTDHHTIRGTVLMPVVRAFRTLRRGEAGNAPAPAPDGPRSLASGVG